MKLDILFRFLMIFVDKILFINKFKNPELLKIFKIFLKNIIK